MAETTPGEFNINILEVKTHAVDGMPDAIKFVTWSITYTKDNKTEGAGAYTTELPDPVLESYVPFNELTPEQLTAWIENADERMPGIKSFLENKVNTELAKEALVSKPLPWATQPGALPSDLSVLAPPPPPST